VTGTQDVPSALVTLGVQALADALSEQYPHLVFVVRKDGLGSLPGALPPSHDGAVARKVGSAR